MTTKWIDKGTFSAADINGVYVEKSSNMTGIIYTAFFQSKLNGKTTPLETNTWIGMRNVIARYKKAGTKFFGVVYDRGIINRGDV